MELEFGWKLAAILVIGVFALVVLVGLWGRFVAFEPDPDSQAGEKRAEKAAIPKEGSSLVGLK